MQELIVFEFFIHKLCDSTEQHTLCGTEQLKNINLTVMIGTMVM